MSELKPCPFCGGEAETDDLFQEADGTIIPAKVMCPNCHIGFYAKPKHIVFGWATHDEKAEAMDVATRMWNRRAEEE